MVLDYGLWRVVQAGQLLWAPLARDQEKHVVSATKVVAAPPAAPARVALEEHHLIRVGDAVVVIQSSDAFSMRLQGHALEGGDLGAKVQVQVNAWNKTTVLSGKVSGKGEVRIGG